MQIMKQNDWFHGKRDPTSTQARQGCNGPHAERKSAMTSHPTRRGVLASTSSFLAAGVVMKTLAPLAPAAAAASIPEQPARFRIRISDETLARIAERVRAAHLPVTSKGAGWRYGVDAHWFDELVAYWRDAYDWRAAESRINATPQYLASIEGRDVHFARIEPKGGRTDRPPIMLLHGWPYSFVTMLPLAERLSTEGFDVIVPSLPGVAFSQPADDEVRGLRFISRRLDRLMIEALGHDRYLIQGGDFGAVIGDWIAVDTPGHVAGLHTNMIALRHAGAGYGSAGPA
jgi:hypothetical protein